jgi:hypothetical protein
MHGGVEFYWSLAYALFDGEIAEFRGAWGI